MEPKSISSPAFTASTKALIFLTLNMRVAPTLKETLGMQALAAVADGAGTSITGWIRTAGSSRSSESAREISPWLDRSSMRMPDSDVASPGFSFSR